MYLVSIILLMKGPHSVFLPTLMTLVCTCDLHKDCKLRFAMQILKVNATQAKGFNRVCYPRDMYD